MASGTIKRNKTIVSFTHTFSANYTAGTIGTRGAQDSVDSPYPVSNLIGIVTTSIASSSDYSALAFSSGSTLYCNFYRASPNAAQAAATVRFIYEI